MSRLFINTLIYIGLVASFQTVLMVNSNIRHKYIERSKYTRNECLNRLHCAIFRGSFRTSRSRHYKDQMCAKLLSVCKIKNFCYNTNSVRGVRRTYGLCRKNLYTVVRRGHLAGCVALRW